MRTSIRSLCVCGVVASLAMVIVIVGVTTRLRSRAPRDSKISAIESLGGHVIYNRDGSVDVVAFRNQYVSASHTRALTELGRFRRLDFSYSRLADADLSFLASLPPIRDLDVSDTNISPGALKEVARCPSIEAVCASRTRVDDSAIAAIAGLPKLRHLFLDGTPISDSGLMSLRRARGLETLSIADTHVTDSGVASLLVCLPQLEGLVLRNCPVGPKTMREVGRLMGLISLNLEGTQVADADIKWLRGLRKLEGLDLSNTSITPSAIAQLQSALPNMGVRVAETKEKKQE
jgi:hypothetical protein